MPHTPQSTEYTTCCAESLTEEELHQKKLQDLRDRIFLEGQIPWKWAVAAYVALAAITTGVTPQLFPGVKAYYIVIGQPPP